MTSENTKRVAKSKTQRCKRQLATFQEFQDLSCPFSLFFLDSVLPSAISQSTLFDRSFLQSPIELDFIHRVYSIPIHPSTFTLYRQSIFMIYLNERLDNSFTRYTYFLFSFSKLAILRRCPAALPPRPAWSRLRLSFQSPDNLPRQSFQFRSRSSVLNFINATGHTHTLRRWAEDEGAGETG